MQNHPHPHRWVRFVVPALTVYIAFVFLQSLFFKFSDFLCWRLLRKAIFGVSLNT